jgi:hypothetical protein
VREDSSFSEEKEAKRLLSIGVELLQLNRHRGEKFFGSFFQERTILRFEAMNR